jgi:membrane protein
MKKFLDNSLFKIVLMLVLLALTVSSFQNQNNGIQYVFLVIFVLYTCSLLFTNFFKSLTYIIGLIVYEVIISILLLQFESLLGMTLLATFIPLTISSIFLNEIILDHFKITSKRLLITILVNLLTVLMLLAYVYFSKSINSLLCILIYLIVEVVFVTILFNRKADSN